MVFGVLAKFLRVIVVTVVASCKRAACFLQRRRKNSGTLLPLHNVSIGSAASADGQLLGPSEVPASGPEEPLESWTAWTDDGFQAQNLNAVSSYNSSGESMRQNRLPSLTAQMDSNVEDDVPDYFKDMVPAIKKPAKIVIKRKDDDFPDARSLSSRLSFKESVSALPVGSDLGAWDDSQNAWEEEDLTGEMTAAARERRRAERERRLMEHQQKKLDKEIKRVGSGSKKDPASVLMATKLS